MSLEEELTVKRRSFRSRHEIEQIILRMHRGERVGSTSGYSEFTNRFYRAHRLIGGKREPLDILMRKDQGFEEYATPFERQRSVLVHPAKRFTPIVDERMTVVGHFGSVGGGHFTDLIVPLAAVQHRPGESKAYYVSDVGELLRDEIRVFVHDRDTAPPSGWAVINVLTTEHRNEVVTGINGEVLDVVVSNTGFLESVSYSPADFLSMGRLLVALSAKVGGKMVRTLMRKSIALRSAKVLDEPTLKLAKEVEEKIAKDLTKREASMIFKGIQMGRGYDPRMGIPQEHFTAMVEAAKEAGVIAIFRSNKKAAIELIRKGAHGKPMWAKFKTSAETGVLTASNFGEVAAANMNGHFVVAAEDVANGVARKTTTVGGKTVTEFVKLKTHPHWKVQPGQVVAKDGHPIVGDYDLLGVAPIKSPGRNISSVPDDIAYGDWTGPDVRKYLAAVNKKGRLDEPRVLHGAQDQYGGNPKYMGLTDDTAYAVFPDGRSFVMEGRSAQQAFYDAMGRQAKSPGAPKGVPGWKPTVVK